MVDIEARLKEIGIVLPPASPPSHSYVSARQTGSLLYISGHVSKRDGQYPYMGKLGAGVTLEQGQECARICIINCLTSAKHYLGDLNRVKGVIKLVGYVASAPTFTEQPRIGPECLLDLDALLGAQLARGGDDELSEFVVHPVPPTGSRYRLFVDCQAALGSGCMIRNSPDRSRRCACSFMVSSS